MLPLLEEPAPPAPPGVRGVVALRSLVVWPDELPVAPVPDEILARDYPNVAAAGRYFRADEFDANFEIGLEMLLEGVELLARAGKDRYASERT